MFGIAMFWVEICMQDFRLRLSTVRTRLSVTRAATVLQLEWLAPRVFERGLLLVLNCCVC
jgi:hypothetical protein